MSRGIYNITLYENKGIDITYLQNGSVHSISTTGQTLTFDFCYNPEFESEIKRGSGNADIYDRTIRLEVKEETNYSELLSVLDTYYGWIPVLTDNEGVEIAIIDPFFLQESEENWQQGVNYQIELKHNVDSDIDTLAYTAQGVGIGFWIIEDTFIVQ